MRQLFTSNNPYSMNWSQQEDTILKALKENEQYVQWTTISEKLSELFDNKYHTPKQCRERYINYVKFQRKNHPLNQWSQQEKQLLFEQYEKVGSNWSVIASSFNFKSENTLKNKFYGGLRKLLRRLNTIGKTEKRLKKQLKYESLIKPLEISKTLSKDPEVVEAAINLRTQILSFLRSELTQLTEESGLDFINKVNKFNLVNRSMNCKKIKTSNEGPTKGVANYNQKMMIKDSGDVAHISIRKGSESTRDGNTNESKSNEENFVNSNFSFEVFNGENEPNLLQLLDSLHMAGNNPQQTFKQASTLILNQALLKSSFSLVSKKQL